MRFSSILFVLLLALAPAFAASFVTTSHYDMALGEDDALVSWHLNYSTELKNLRLTLTLILPSNSTMLSASDSQGQITNYNFKKSADSPVLVITGKNGPEGGPIALDIEYRIAPFATQKFGRLRITQPLCLAITDHFSADITLPEDAVLITSTPKSSYGTRNAHISSLGDCIELSYLRGPQFEGAGGYSYVPFTHYDVFARNVDQKLRTEVSEVDSRASILPAITGLEAPYPRWTVLVAGDDLLPLESEAGLYTGAGIIYLREDYNNSLAPILAHETTHGFNSIVLQWTDGKSFWFEEGTADYAAHLSVLDIGIEDPDMFVKGSSYYSSSYSELADYYQSGDNRMESWDFSSLDSFSYDYSQFIIRAYVDAYGTDALKQAYACLGRIPPETNATTSAEINGLVLGCMSRSAGNVSFESILYPGKDVFAQNQRTFERYAAAIGSATWKGTAKPLPASAYDLPPLPNELESKAALDALSATFASLEPFTSESAASTYQDALARYKLAQSEYDARNYAQSLEHSNYASNLLSTAIIMQNIYSSQNGQPSGPTDNGQPQRKSQPQAAACPPLRCLRSSCWPTSAPRRGAFLDCFKLRNLQQTQVFRSQKHFKSLRRKDRTSQFGY
ncbi:MAG: hypothetical protein WC759_00730 [Candidatus Micrarchaeia archaeon]|jgi:hypothetical protein